MTSKSLEEAAAFWVLGLLPSDECPNVATEALVRGIDSPSLRLLAGELRPIASEVDPLFERSLVENGIAVPDRQTARAAVARYYAREMLAGSLSPWEGAERIWWDVANDAYSAPDWERYSSFVGLASGLRDNPQHRTEYEREIVAAAHRLLESSGRNREWRR